MIVVDSSVWIDYFNGTDTRETALLDDILGKQAVAIGDLVMAEVLQGFRDDRELRFAQAVLETLFSGRWLVAPTLLRASETIALCVPLAPLFARRLIC